MAQIERHRNPIKVLASGLQSLADNVLADSLDTDWKQFDTETFSFEFFKEGTREGGWGVILISWIVVSCRTIEASLKCRNSMSGFHRPGRHWLRNGGGGVRGRRHPVSSSLDARTIVGRFAF